MASVSDDQRLQLQQQLAEISSSVARMSSLLQQQTAKRPMLATEEPPAKIAKVSNVSADDTATAVSTLSCDWTGSGSDLGALRQQLRSFAKERDWDQFHTPRNICLALVGEVGELCELFQWKGDGGCGEGLPGWEDKKREHLGEECADVLLYLIRLADKCGIDLPAAASRKIARNAAKCECRACPRPVIATLPVTLCSVACDSSPP